MNIRLGWAPVAPAALGHQLGEGGVDDRGAVPPPLRASAPRRAGRRGTRASGRSERPSPPSRSQPSCRRVYLHIRGTDAVERIGAAGEALDQVGGVRSGRDRTPSPAICRSAMTWRASVRIDQAKGSTTVPASQQAKNHCWCDILRPGSVPPGEEPCGDAPEGRQRQRPPQGQPSRRSRRRRSAVRSRRSRRPASLAAPYSPPCRRPREERPAADRQDERHQPPARQSSGSRALPSAPTSPRLRAIAERGDTRPPRPPAPHCSPAASARRPDPPAASRRRLGGPVERDSGRAVQPARSGRDR